MPPAEPNPPATGFSLEVDASAPAVTVAGELDLLTSPRLQTALTELIDSRKPARLVADLSAVTFFDSSALNVMLQAQRHAKENAVVLQLVPSAAVSRVIELTGVAEHLTLADEPPV